MTASTPRTITAALRSAGYEPRRPEVLALAWALRGDASEGARALLLEGPPGVGKSALAQAAAAATGRELVVCQLHAWTDADELFVGVDVAAAVAGDAEHVREDGVLAVVARISQERPVVLLLDEIDKAPERAEALLLDWLQTGRVPVAPGQHLATDLSRVLVIVTSNGERDLSEALMRRCRRVAMEPLPVEIQERILRERTGAPRGVVRLAWRIARAVAQCDGVEALSLQEGAHLLEELELAESLEDARLALAGWAARGSQGRRHAAEVVTAEALWGEIRRGRR